MNQNIVAHKPYGESPTPTALKIIPMYVHRRVGALKIESIVDSVEAQGGTIGDAPPVAQPTEGGKVLMFEDAGYDAVGVSAEYMEKFRPEAGGYYTVDHEGHPGYLTAEEFARDFVPV